MHWTFGSGQTRHGPVKARTAGGEAGTFDVVAVVVLVGVLVVAVASTVCRGWLRYPDVCGRTGGCWGCGEAEAALPAPETLLGAGVGDSVSGRGAEADADGPRGSGTAEVATAPGPAGSGELPVWPAGSAEGTRWTAGSGDFTLRLGGSGEVTLRVGGSGEVTFRTAAAGAVDRGVAGSGMGETAARGAGDVTRRGAGVGVARVCWGLSQRKFKCQIVLAFRNRMVAVPLTPRAPCRRRRGPRLSPRRSCSGPPRS